MTFKHHSGEFYFIPVEGKSASIQNLNDKFIQIIDVDSNEGRREKRRKQYSTDEILRVKKINLHA